MAVKNNVTRLLAQRGIDHQVIELPSDDKRTAEATAALLGVEPDLVFKTIVVKRTEPKARPLLVMIPAPTEVDLRRLAASLGEKKLSLPTQREAEQLTGLQAGGISALALLNHGFDVVLDEYAQTLDHLYISGGQRGLSLRLRPADLIELTGARCLAAT